LERYLKSAIMAPLAIFMNWWSILNNRLWSRR
jgi:hypothetical protein